MATTQVRVAGVTVDWQATVVAAVIAGAVFLVLEMFLVAVFAGQSVWGPPRMIAAIVLGRDALPPPATFDFGIVLTALVVHFVLAIVFAFILAWLIAGLTLGRALLAGGVFGLALYLINFYPIAAAFFPWFAMARNWMSLFAHIVFGLVLAWSYKRLASR